MLVLRASAHTGSQQPASAPAPESATDAEAVKVVEAVKALETKVKELTEQLEAVKQLEGDEAPWQGQTRQRRKRKQARAGPGMRARARARSGAATFLMTSAAWRPRRIGTFLDKGMGYVLVDVRPSGEVDPRVQMTLQMLVFEHNVRAARWVRLRRGSGAALWVSASMSAKVPPLVHELATVRSLPEGVNALIGKAYALLHSPFNISVLVDGDSWICPDWWPKLQARFGTDFDVAWTKAAVRLGYHRRTDSPYLAGLRGPARVRWLNFDERNTGTVVVVRSSNRSEAWLREVLAAYPHYEALRAKLDAPLPPPRPDTRRRRKPNLMLGHGQTGVWTRDQPAWREATFKQIQRGQLHELLLPMDVGCRDMAAPLGKHRRCACECECTACLFLHDHAVTGHVRYSGCAAQAAAAYLQRCRDLAPWLSPLALSACERMLAGWNRTRH